MLQRTVTSVVLVFAAILTCARPAHAQQTLNFTLGHFAPLGEDARASDDVLNINRTFLVFDIDDFGGASVGGEWLLPLGNFFEAGAGVSYSEQRCPACMGTSSTPTEPSSIRTWSCVWSRLPSPFGYCRSDNEHRFSRTSAEVWASSTGATVKVANSSTSMPAARSSRIVSRPRHFDRTLVLGGVRFAGRRFSAGGEIRYQHAEGDLPNDFAGRRIDLGGWTYNFTVGPRF